MRCARQTSAIGLGPLLAPALIGLCGDDQQRVGQDPEAAISKALESLPQADRKRAEAQRYCAAETTSGHGSMGTPEELDMAGRTVFVCCDHCKEAAPADPKTTLPQVGKLKKIATARSRLTLEDRCAAEAQACCAASSARRRRRVARKENSGRRRHCEPLIPSPQSEVLRLRDFSLR